MPEYILSFAFFSPLPLKNTWKQMLTIVCSSSNVGALLIQVFTCCHFFLFPFGLSSTSLSTSVQVIFFFLDAMQCRYLCCQHLNLFLHACSFWEEHECGTSHAGHDCWPSLHLYLLCPLEYTQAVKELGKKGRWGRKPHENAHTKHPYQGPCPCSRTESPANLAPSSGLRLLPSLHWGLPFL